MFPLFLGLVVDIDAPWLCYKLLGLRFAEGKRHRRQVGPKSRWSLHVKAVFRAYLR